MRDNRFRHNRQFKKNHSDDIRHDIRNDSERQNNDSVFQISVAEITSMHDSRRKKSGAEKFIAGGIMAALGAIMISLFIYFRPSTLDDMASLADKTHSLASSYLAQIRVAIWGSVLNDCSSIGKTIASQACQPEFSFLAGENISYIDHTTEVGDISLFRSEPVFYPPEDAIFSYMLDTAMGPLLYYCQGDARWKDYLYGGADPIGRYGCGPVCAAMIINSFSSTGVTPIEIADWSVANGCYAPQSGSYHSLIPNSISAYGLKVESVTDRSVEHVTELLRTGHVLVALMGKGSLTKNGHFIIIAQLCYNGNVYIADPASYENCTREWDLQQLLNELKRSYDSGGPLWAVSIP